ncbi:MAG TPA: formylglycine-generating enzyme family protein [Methylibium sp.]|nr:formylglycine-generating enzyme family protein [Methylibium sp.]
MRRPLPARWSLVAAAALGAGLLSHQPAPRAVEAGPEAGLCDAYNGLPGEEGPHAGMVRIRGERFQIGSDEGYPEERPALPADVADFWIDRHPVTNAQFARFVAATGHVTSAERAGPGGMPAGSAVFEPPVGPEPGRWRFTAGANWRQPRGPGSDVAGRDNHPVVHVSHDDAAAYARWAGRDLPTEAEWEYAARGGLAGQRYAWGAEAQPNGHHMANTWQGRFPFENTREDGHAATSPVGCFRPNGYGLFDMAGNVWQWTASAYRPGHRADASGRLAAPDDGESLDPRQPGVPVRVIKGGSHLCAPSYCLRYRPSARQPQATATGTSHLGFRTVARS